ncbi:MAG: ZIP family metal transporter [Euryarchaeota archaeon]|nr:ZIP family metal transporter [Euryarchaeota archaeon]
MKESLLNRILLILIATAAGALIGVSFLDLLPEAMDKGTSSDIFSYVLLGIVSFFILERFIFWHHCHDGKCEVHTFTYLNLMGDGVHNFIDGATIAATFLTSIPLGTATTLAIIFHEIPQEIGDFGILVYGGFSKIKALSYNFLSALAAFIGAVAIYFFSPYIGDSIAFLLAFAAGGFIYIASADLMPELKKEIKFERSITQLAFLLIGIFLIWIIIRTFE